MAQKDLFNKDNAIEFYETRYEDGYMEEWDRFKKEKVFRLIKELNLPSTGKVLDYGCGNGVFTKVIKAALPDWEVFGVEISPTAVSNASERIPDCTFFHFSEKENYSGQFDLLFSHHVIEHVQNLDETFAEIDHYLKPVASQFHILPCGNENSYEYNIAILHNNGIEAGKQNRFFYEEPGHLRRLNSQEFSQYEKKIGFELVKEWYANQKDGAVNWITKSSPRFVKRLTDAGSASNQEAAEKLKQLRSVLLPKTYRQFAYTKFWEIKSKWKKSIKDYALLSILFIPAILSKPFYLNLQKKADEEWEKRRTEKNGSEMFLFYSRS